MAEEENFINLSDAIGCSASTAEAREAVKQGLAAAMDRRWVKKIIGLLEAYVARNLQTAVRPPSTASVAP